MADGFDVLVDPRRDEGLGFRLGAALAEQLNKLLGRPTFEQRREDFLNQIAGARPGGMGEPEIAQALDVAARAGATPTQLGAFLVTALERERLREQPVNPVVAGQLETSLGLKPGTLRDATADDVDRLLQIAGTRPAPRVFELPTLARPSGPPVPPPPEGVETLEVTAPPPPPVPAAQFYRVDPSTGKIERLGRPIPVAPERREGGASGLVKTTIQRPTADGKGVEKVDVIVDKATGMTIPIEGAAPVPVGEEGPSVTVMTPSGEVITGRAAEVIQERTELERRKAVRELRGRRVQAQRYARLVGRALQVAQTGGGIVGARLSGLAAQAEGIANEIIEGGKLLGIPSLDALHAFEPPGLALVAEKGSRLRNLQLELAAIHAAFVNPGERRIPQAAIEHSVRALQGIFSPVPRQQFAAAQEALASVVAAYNLEAQDLGQPVLTPKDFSPLVQAILEAGPPPAPTEPAGPEPAQPGRRVFTPEEYLQFLQREGR